MDVTVSDAGLNEGPLLDVAGIVDLVPDSTEPIPVSLK